MTVTDPQGRELSRDYVTVSESGAPVSVRVSGLQSQQETESGTVSVKRLQHKVPKQAQKLFKKAMGKAAAGDSEGAISLLQEAVQIDPEYVEALNNLATRYIITGQAERAMSHLQNAIRINSHESKLFTNMSLALLSLNRPKEAELAARQALKLDPADRRARYMLGMSLFSQRKFQEETMAALRQTQDVFPRAQLALAAAEIAAGHTAEARRTLKEYLASNRGDMKSVAEQMLSQIEAKAEVAAN